MTQFIVVCILILGPLLLVAAVDSKPTYVKFKYKIKPYKCDWKTAAKYRELNEKNYKAMMKAKNRYISVGYSDPIKAEHFKLAHSDMINLKPKKKKDEEI